MPALPVLLTLLLAGAPADPEPIVVSGRTLIAFAPIVSEQELASLSDNAIALDDFERYLPRIRDLLAPCHVAVFEIAGPSFRYREGRKVHVVRPPADNPFGFWLKVPGKKPMTLSGVHTDADLQVIATEYFQCATR